jgi:integrase
MIQSTAMNAIATALAESNLIPLPTVVRRANRVKPSRFIMREYKNASGTTSWRVTGRKRDKTRIRENFADEKEAEARQIDLELEWKRGDVRSELKATKLTDEQLSLASLAVHKLGEDWRRLLDVIEHWHRSGANNAPIESPRIDNAVEQYLVWLEASPFRDATKRHWKIRMNLFRNSVQNMRVAEVTRKHIDEFLAGRKVSAIGKDTDRRAVSRFFSWAMEHDQQWATFNPCARKEHEKNLGQRKQPQILAHDQCKALMAAAQKHRKGRLVPYLALCLFGGLRPAEPARIAWSNINLQDREINLPAEAVKTGRKSQCGRVVEICDTLHAWLKKYEGVELFPANFWKDLRAIRKGAKITKWPKDVLRHTAISNHFRRHQSYGKAAEQFGNSEAVIKRDYQARVSTDDMKKFYALRPRK